MGVDTSKGSKAMDYAEHERTYSGFVKGCVIVGTLSALLLVALAIVLL